MTLSFWLEIAAASFVLVLILVAGWVEIAASPVSRLSLRQFLDERYLRGPSDDIDAGQRLRFAMLIVQAVGMVLVAGLLIDAVLRTELEFAVLIGTLIAVLASVIAARVLPRALAGDDSTPGSPRALRIGRWMRWLFSPVVVPAEWLVRLVADGRETEDEDEVILATENGEEENGSNGDNGQQDDVDEEDFYMISGILHLVDSTADDIMVPRLDLVAIPATSTIGDAVNAAITAGHSRIPVFGESIDEILGIIYAKDLLKYVTEDKAHEPIEAEIRPAYYVPESKRIDDLLQELQQERIHMAIVVDEYGGTAGVVTIEDILEEIVGEIVDEYDVEQPQVQTVSDTELRVDGRVLVEDVLEKLDVPREERSEGTVAGLLQRELGRIPRVGDEVSVDGLCYKVESVERRRIRQVYIEKLDGQAEHVDMGEHASQSAS